MGILQWYGMIAYILYSVGIFMFATEPASSGFVASLVVCSATFGVLLYIMVRREVLERPVR